VQSAQQSKPLFVQSAKMKNFLQKVLTSLLLYATMGTTKETTTNHTNKPLHF